MPAFAAAGEQAEAVGELGDLERISFDGVNAFTPEQIKAALAGDLEFVIASYPNAPLATFLDILCDKLRSGYLHAGFIDPQVAAVPHRDDGRVVVTVNEGQHFDFDGTIVVDGARTVPADAIVAHLLAEDDPDGRRSLPPPGEPTLASLLAKRDWNGGRPLPYRPGEPAARDPLALKQLDSAVKRAFAWLGHPFVRATVEQQSDPKTGKASLLVHVQDEGPRAILKEIDLTGCEKNTREDVMKYLGLEIGMPIDGRKTMEITDALGASARFLHVKADLDQTGADGARLRLDLQEYEEAPKLTEELSEAEKILLAVHRRAAAINAGGVDLEATLQGEAARALADTLASAKLLFSPDGGLILTLQGTRPDAPIVIVFSRDRIGVYSSAPRRKLELPMPERPPQLTIKIGMAFDPAQGGDRPFSATFGAHIGPSDDGAPARMELNLSPVAFIALAHPTDGTCTVENGVVKTTRHGWIIEFSDQPGRPVVRAGSVVIRIEKGVYAERLAEIEKGAKDVPNLYDPARPVSSSLETLLEAILGSFRKGDDPQAAEKAVQAVRALPLDKAFPALAASLDELALSDKFAIPREEPPPMEVLASRAIAVSGRLFPRGSWPWTLARETALNLCGKARYTMPELVRLYQSDQTGPIGCLAAAKLLKLAKIDPLATGFAIKGLRNLTPDAFHRDLGMLLAGDSLAAQYALSLLVALGEADAAAIEPLVSTLPAAE
ncbi:MAG TPA: hypothetical protein VNE39_04675, partial [Planctomycetota bacterium]|nr:hypothetical protein [Planctomycetota bacterium]